MPPALIFLVAVRTRHMPTTLVQSVYIPARKICAPTGSNVGSLNFLLVQKSFMKARLHSQLMAHRASAIVLDDDEMLTVWL